MAARVVGLAVTGWMLLAAPAMAHGVAPDDAAFFLANRGPAIGPFVEYKYRLEAGRGMVYTWSATNWVRSEMHSEADGAPAGTAEFFEVADRTLFRHGSYVAPFPGIHGWYWLNQGTDTVTVTLHAAGFFSTSTVFRDSVPPLVRELTQTPEPGAYRPDF